MDALGSFTLSAALLVGSVGSPDSIPQAQDPREATVLIQAELSPGWPIGTGAGVIVGASDQTVRILTVAHIFRDNSGHVRTTSGVVGFYSSLKNGPADLSDVTDVQFASTADLAIVTVRAPRSHRYPTVHLANDLPSVGDALTVVGHPEGRQYFVEAAATVVAGSVATYDFAFRCDACVPGDSGGGVFNARGELVGIEVGSSNLADNEGHVVVANANYSQPVPAIEEFLAVHSAF